MIDIFTDADRRHHAKLFT